MKDQTDSAYTTKLYALPTRVAILLVYDFIMGIPLVALSMFMSSRVDISPSDYLFNNRPQNFATRSDDLRSSFPLRARK